MTALKDRLVVLVGGGGFIGRYAAQALLRAGARIRIAQRDPRAAWFLKTQGGLGQTQFAAADLTRPETLARVVAGADAVVNLTGTFATGQMQALHVDGPAALARAAAEAGASGFVQLSAIGADPGSDAVYGRSKGLGEAAVRAVFPQATILRPSTVFGREDRFVNRFAGMIAGAPIVPVLRSGVRFQPVFVGDVADAIAAALADPDARGQAYELGGPDVLTMLALQRWIADAIGRRTRFVALPDVAGNLLSYAGALPGAPITRDQWKMLQADTVVRGADGLSALGIAATPLAAVAPAWLVRYRRQGRFADRLAA
ncbi:MAG: complex I NDUFA9 subunit family protein [Pseudomonadota bacterium]